MSIECLVVAKKFLLASLWGLSQASIQVSPTELHTAAPLRVYLLPGLIRNNAFL